MLNICEYLINKQTKERNRNLPNADIIIDIDSTLEQFIYLRRENKDFTKDFKWMRLDKGETKTGILTFTDNAYICFIASHSNIDNIDTFRFYFTENPNEVDIDDWSGMAQEWFNTKHSTSIVYRAKTFMSYLRIWWDKEIYKIFP